ncbi:MAG: pyridoxal phosphate-dependent aminotransferase [DPANN group archaeon]|nr:pyridoxal phosphate-dependent aminotransferase [DPANN group archaeon]
MVQTIAKRVLEIKASPIRRIAAMIEKAAHDPNIISFGGGAPSLAPPQEVTDYLCDLMKKRRQWATSYTSTQGISELISEIRHLLKREEKVNLESEENITITSGGTEGLLLSMFALVNPGEEVIITDPTYVGYNQPILLAGGVPKTIPLHYDEDYQFSGEDIEKIVTKKTTAVLVCDPDNPTGRVLEKDNMKSIVDVCEDKKLWLITDDVYKDILYDGRKFVNWRTYGSGDNIISCCSFSKSGSLPGIRLGYNYGPRNVVNEMQKLKQFTSLCSSKTAQLMALKLIENKGKIKNEYVSKTVIPTYEKRRDAMMKQFQEQLPDAGISKPKGAFYFFANMSNYYDFKKHPDSEIADKLFAEKKTVLIPGQGFGETSKNHQRFTFVSENEERIAEGMQRISKFFDSLK